MILSVCFFLAFTSFSIYCAYLFILHAKCGVLIGKSPPKTRAYEFYSCALVFGGGKGIRTLVGLRPNGFQEVYQRIPFQLSSVQFRLKQFSKILILQGFWGLFGTDMNQNELIGIDTDPSFFEEFFALWREFGENSREKNCNCSTSRFFFFWREFFTI